MAPVAESSAQFRTVPDPTPQESRASGLRDHAWDASFQTGSGAQLGSWRTNALNKQVSQETHCISVFSGARGATHVPEDASMMLPQFFSTK